ncbi:ketopantoate reductase family protein [Marinospirillum alkaliphilum]|uniref:2-dehydropantoate 2-reductase n=1 Tax=Marinospirillum alkaliphilum DSM 21637 TaxID=1122209 RepID=A0A1K1TNY4_9GAMM|nr:2-dehydropantoate 2-reductase [Marinospirillum alkaliphilum]SFX01707.1 2-dehydropantoate 2-reductase [Marinospirillum alkaliphilum DSM 21637]
MRFLILGAGGIGCYYGARLQQAGHQVVYVARGEHLRAMQQQGLKVEHESFRFEAPVTAVDEAALLADYSVTDFDLLLVCFKSQDTAAWLDRCRDWLLAGATPLLSLQNGVDNEPELEAVVGTSRTLGGIALRIGGHIEAPGVITASGPAQIIFGAWPDQTSGQVPTDQLQAFDQAFQQAGIPSRISDRIAVELWRKLMLNNAVNPLSALTRLDTQTLSTHPLFGASVYQLMQETAAIAAAEGLPIGQQDVEEMYQLICNFDGIKTSMLVDLEKGRPLELDGISGTLLKRGKRLAINTPMTALVYGLLSQQQECH